MRYTARARLVMDGWSSAVVETSSDVLLPSRLAMRHARAMLEVQREARALVRAHRLSDAARAHAARASSAILDDALGGVARANVTTRRAFERPRAAVAKLDAVEKEVRRG